jgi:uncharacterized membrane protein (UPF0127 family)
MKHWVQKTIQVVSLAVCIVSAGFIIFLYLISSAPSQQGIPQACVRDHCFDVELARTSSEREEGLMFRDHLGENAGMLFVFSDQQNYPFWMKNMLIPLDIIWVNRDHTVVALWQNAQPCGSECQPTMPKKSAQYVLEVNAGTVDKLGIQEGDSVVLRF